MRTPLLLAAVGAFATFGAAASHAQNTSPNDFLTKAIQGDNSEIALGKLAAEKGATAETRRFGQMLERDHARSKKQTLPLARKFGVQPTDELAPEAQAELQKLQGLHGRDFDREFARYMTHDHEQDIHDFTEEAHRGPPPVAHLARETLPTLHKHLDMAKQIDHREG